MRRIFLYTMIVDGQNSWELRGVKTGVLRVILGKVTK